MTYEPFVCYPGNTIFTGMGWMGTLVAEVRVVSPNKENERT